MSGISGTVGLENQSFVLNACIKFVVEVLFVTPLLVNREVGVLYAFAGDCIL